MGKAPEKCKDAIIDIITGALLQILVVYYIVLVKIIYCLLNNLKFVLQIIIAKLSKLYL